MPDPQMNQLQPLTADEWPGVLADLKATFFAKAHVYRVMAHHPALVRAWTGLRQHIVLDTALGRTRSEIVILRASAKLGSAYEWSHHVVRARALGMDDARIASLDGDIRSMGSDDAIIASAVDQLIEGARLSSEILDDLSRLVGAEGVLDLMATVGFYSTLAFILNSFDTQIEDEILEALEADPLAGRP